MNYLEERRAIMAERKAFFQRRPDLKPLIGFSQPGDAELSDDDRRAALIARKERLAEAEARHKANPPGLPRRERREAIPEAFSGPNPDISYGDWD